MKNNKIGKKLFKKIFGWYIVLAIILGLLQFFSEYRYAKQQLIAELTFLSSAFYEPLDNSIWNLDEEQIQANVESIVALESVDGLCIYDMAGNVVAKDGRVPSADDTTHFIMHSFDIIHNENDIQEKIAHVNIYSSNSVVFSRIQNSIVMILVIAIIKSALLFLLFLYFTNKILSIPLGRLVGAVKKVEPSHYEKIPTPSKDGDELSTLTDEYNKMGLRMTTLFSEVVQTKNHLYEEHKYLQSIVDSSDNPLMVIRDDYVVKMMNKNLCHNLELYDIADKENPKCYELLHDRKTPCTDTHECPLEIVKQSLQKTVVIHEHFDCDGKKKHMEVVATPLLDEAGECIGIIEASHDISNEIVLKNELREYKNTIEYKKNYDALTNLPNRALLNQILEGFIEDSDINESTFAVMFVDIDRFKHINDSLGHEIGDRVLRVVAERIKAKALNSHCMARMGSDEFAVLEHGFDDIAEVAHKAQKLLEVISQPIHIDGHTLYITSSIGISIYPKDDTNAYNLFKYADTAMHKVKDDGKNHFQFYSSEMTKLALERVSLETNLRKALDNNEFVVYYQPQIDIKSNTIKGMEALVRWLHPKDGLIPPNKFIPLAEETSFIIELDRVVMAKAMQEVKSWYDMGLNPGVLSLNLASKQLNSHDFIAVLQENMQKFDFQPEWLKFEVTESDVMRDPDAAIQRLQKLIDLGIKVAIDDFGTGYSSLSYLKKLPITKLKIDQSFVRDILSDEDDVAIVKAVIALAENLGLDIIAEGVETSEQKEFLFSLGCEQIQGYLFSKPLPSESFKEYVATFS